MGEFSDRFMSSRWEAVMAANSSLLHLGWDIQNILYEWMDFPEIVSRDSVVCAIRKAVRDNAVELPRIERQSSETHLVEVDLAVGPVHTALTVSSGITRRSELDQPARTVIRARRQILRLDQGRSLSASAVV